MRSRTSLIRTENAPGRAAGGARGGRAARALRSPEGVLALLAALSLVVLGPGRPLFAAVPPVMFLAALLVILLPGLLASGLLLEGRIPPAGHLPVGFTLSAGLFGALAIPVLLVNGSLGLYLALCAPFVAGAVILAVLRALGLVSGGGSGTSRGRGYLRESFGDLLWVPFGLLTAVLAALAPFRVQPLDQDIWAYLGIVQNFLSTASMGQSDPYYGTPAGGVSRLLINGWVVENAALARLSGLDPVDLVQNYLTPALIVVGMLAVYVLARLLFQSETAALLVGCVTGLSLLFYLNGTIFTPGREFVYQINEDKYVARFIFTPVALCFSVLLLREFRWLYLALFTFVCWTVVTIHPIGLAFIGLPVAGLALVHLIFNWRSRRSWLSFAGMGAAFAAVGLPPLAYLYATDNPLVSRLASVNEGVSESLISSWIGWGLLQPAGGDNYILSQGLLFNPLLITAVLLCLPLLVWRLWESLAAQMILGTLILFPLFTYFPPIAGPLGQMVGPWILPRFAWPVSLMVVLALGWTLWEICTFMRRRTDRSGLRALRLSGAALPLALVVLAGAAMAPATVTGARAMSDRGEAPESQPYCLDPAFSWIREEAPSPGRVLAPTAENSCITAGAGEKYILNLRGQTMPGNSEAVRELQQIFETELPDQRTFELLRNLEVDYLLAPAASPLNAQLAHLPGFTPRQAPGGRYEFYTVDRQQLDDAALSGNTAYNTGDFEAAAATYGESAMEDEESGQVIGLLGLARLQSGLEDPVSAVASYERALDLSPQSAPVLASLASLQQDSGEYEAARRSWERAVSLAPESAYYRQQLASTATRLGEPEQTLEHTQSLVKLYPAVPDYRAALGSALNGVGEYAAADREFDRASDRRPRDASLQYDIARYNHSAGRTERTAEHHERATDLDPGNQLYAYQLGTLYAGLSTRNGGEEQYRNQEYYALAVEELERTARLESGQLPLGGAALAALGDLHRSWDRPDLARTAYERALERNPEDTGSRRSLEDLP